MAVQQARVPVLDETGRFPDAYAPPSVAADAQAAQAARAGAESARDGAQEARTGAETARGQAEVARQGAETALAGVPSAVEGAVGQQVEAAQSAATGAVTARGQAEAFAGQAQTSAISAAGSASTATQQAQVGAFLLDQRGSVSGTLDLSGVTQQSFVHATLTGNLTVVLPSAPIVGMTITLELKQDSTGGRTLTMKNIPASFGVPITLSTAANALDEIMCLYDGVRWKARVGGLSDSIPTSWVV